MIYTENGLNVATKCGKGSRSYTRLNTLRIRLCFLAKEFEQRYNIDNLANLTEEMLMSFFSSMRNESIKRKDGKEYLSVADYVKCFKIFVL